MCFVWTVNEGIGDSSKHIVVVVVEVREAFGYLHSVYDDVCGLSFGVGSGFEQHLRFRPLQCRADEPRTETFDAIENLQLHFAGEYAAALLPVALLFGGGRHSDTHLCLGGIDVIHWDGPFDVLHRER